MFKAAETHSIKPHVDQAYRADPVLLEKWHVIAGSSHDQCVLQTVKDLRICKTLQFYTVHESKQFVGYFGTEFEGFYMPTIFIMPGYRSRKDEFWKEIEAKTGPIWKAGIYSKNIPCMKFYAKKGVEIARLETPRGEAALFEFKRSA